MCCDGQYPDFNEVFRGVDLTVYTDLCLKLAV